ncbi:hypothetical protein [Natronosalvus halobius]|uniref:hypothetical protein n=1 Tax=Natronosalvus halobius TaxID=2953746 RepID=UPI0020A12AE5|nr:hypothetical protein [Natronosalvus halobius]USZ73093.1 hypothetical protein NGM15_07265 [Natronosalvus halobius]
MDVLAAIGQRVADCRLDRQGLLASECTSSFLELEGDSVAVGANDDRVVGRFVGLVLVVVSSEAMREERDQERSDSVA